MSTVHEGAWLGGWDAANPPQIGFVSAPADSGTWEKGLRPHLEYRNLGLEQATNGLFAAKHIRVVPGGGGAASDWHCHDLDFQFFYVLKGSITIETAEGEVYTLGAGASGYHPPLSSHREYDFSDDYEVIEIVSPANVETIAGRDTPLPARAAALDPARKPVYTFDTPDQYTLGAGPRSFFRYRDLGTARMTDGRVHVHIVRATQPGAGTGWHYHSMAQWFMILGGSSYIRVEDGPLIKLDVLDSMCIGSGPDMRHNVAPYTGDYAVLEMCIPASYETVAVAPPEEAAPPPDGAKE